MNEFVMALWMMAAPHHQWPAPAPETVTVIRAPEAPRVASRELTPEERAELRQALERYARTLPKAQRRKKS